MLDVAAVLAVIFDHVEDLLERRDLAVVRGDGNAPFPVQLVGLGLVVDHVMAVVRAAGAPTQRTDAMRVEAQAARRRDARILLTQTARGRIARIGERRASRILVLVVQCVEIVPTHEHLATDLHEFGNVLVRSGKVLRDGGDGAHVERDVLAGHAVAARQPLFEHPVAVDEVQRETVDLDLAGHRQRFRLGPVECAQHAVVPFPKLLDGEHVIEAHHTRGVAHGGEIVGERAAHAMRRRLRRIQ